MRGYHIVDLPATRFCGGHEMFGFRLREAVDGEEERVGGLRGVGLQVARDEDVEVGFAVDGGVEGFV